MMAASKTITLNNGMRMPAIGFGTWQSKPNEVKEALKVAIEAGYRYIDCAYLYGNETEVGEAIQEIINEGTVKREDLFIVSKLWSTYHSAEDVRPVLQESLKMLQLDYIDLYLIHWPIAFKRGGEPYPRDDAGKLIYVDTHYMETWRELEKAVDDGLIKSIGVSNFNSRQIQEIIDNGRIKPSNLQIEIHPYLSQEKLVQFCHDNNISVTAYSPFGSPDRPWPEPKPQPLLENENLIAIGKKYNKSSAQVILRWLLQRNVIPIPKSVNPARIKQNLDVFDFILSAEDMATVNAINRNLRLITYGDGDKDLVPSAPHFPFNDEF